MDEELIELNNLAREDGKKHEKKRFIYPEVAASLAHKEHTAIVGPRGSGKTIILKQLLAEEENAFYVSLDISSPAKGLFRLAKELSDAGTKILLLDEIHGYPEFGTELKKIHDFISIKVVLTSSAALILHELSADLSRRMRIIPVRPFSFREYLFFTSNEKPPSLGIKSLLDEGASREYYGKTRHLEAHFTEYLKGKNYPLSLGRRDTLPLFRNMLETIINKDIIRTGKITHDETIHITRLVSYLGKSHSEDMNYTSIAKNIGISRYAAEKYIGLLEKAFVLHIVMPEGNSVMKEPKIMMSLPYRILYKDYDECIGALREDFFVESMVSRGLKIAYLKTNRGEKIPDYLVNGIVFEIGGTGKGHTQFKGISETKKRIILTQPGMIDSTRRPLFLAGLIDKP